MTERVEQVTETTRTPELNQTQTTTASESHEKVSGSSLAARIISFITTVVVVILAVRFVLLLLGANTTNGFVDFILDITGPLVAPFNGIFGNPSSDVRFEPQTLTAIVVYTLIGMGLAYLVKIKQPKP